MSATPDFSLRKQVKAYAFSDEKTYLLKCLVAYTEGRDLRRGTWGPCIVPQSKGGTKLIKRCI